MTEFRILETLFSISYRQVIVAFPAVVAIHNAEEWLRTVPFNRGQSPFLPKALEQPAVFRNALIALTVAIAVVDLFAFVTGTKIWLTISQLAVFAFALNALGHCLLSIVKRALVPGTLSAALLVFPYSTVAIVLMKTSLAEPISSLFRLALASLVATPVVILIFLLIGYTAQMRH